MSRDNFTKKTIEVLAQRVNFTCSNPDCKKPTSGPHSEEGKSLRIGVAAHITAASAGGPRFDEGMENEDRSSITNGIWLCESCHAAIDKDVDAFPTTLLKEWKLNAESEALEAMMGKFAEQKNSKPQPFIECDHVWSNAGRSPLGYSEDNWKEGEERVIHAGQKYIQLYRLDWRMKLLLHNNSSAPVFNIKIEFIEGNAPNYLSEIPKVNNLPPFECLELEMKIEDFFEGYYTDADKLMTMEIPEKMIGSKAVITYYDEQRNELKSLIEFTDSGITTSKM